MFAERVAFSSGDLVLEGVLRYPEDGTCDRAAILFSPHPKLGGDMENNVIKGIASHLAGVGYVALSFNYRSVGGSGSSSPEVSPYDYWSALDESGNYQEIVADGLAALQYAKGLSNVRRFFLVGYSFGARIMEEVAAVAAPEGVAAISLPVRFHDFSTLANLAVKKLLVWGDGDFTGSETEAEAFAAKVIPPKQVIILRGQDHFFRGHEKELAKWIGDAFGND